MKKAISFILAIILALSSLMTAFAGDITLLTKDSSELSESGVGISDGTFKNWNEDGFIGFKDVDFTGAKSVRIKARINYMRGDNGEAFGVYIDDPIKGDCLGYILVNEERQDYTYYGVNI